MTNRHCNLILILILLLIVISGPGCSEKPNPQIQILQAQVEQLRTESADLHAEIGQLRSSQLEILDVMRGMTTNSETYVNQTTGILIAMNQRISTLEATNPAAPIYILPAAKVETPVNPRMRTTGTGSKVSSLVLGIPLDQFRGIKSKAQRDWPDNFNMQEYQIKQEVAAYKKVNP